MHPTAQPRPDRRDAHAAAASRTLLRRFRHPDHTGLGADRGSVSLIVVVLAIGMFAMAGLVIDGGIALDTRGRATALAQEAARAGANAVSPTSLRGPRPDLRMDPTAATRAARQVLDAAGAHGEITVNGSQVTVTAHLTHRPVMLSAIGVSELTGSGTATATLLHGTTTGRTG